MLCFQIQMAVQYITGLQSLLFETLSFLLTVLAATVTPVFVLSQHWLHLPCGCIINCRRSSYAVSSQDAKSKSGRVASCTRPSLVTFLASSRALLFLGLYVKIAGGTEWVTGIIWCQLQMLRAKYF